MVESEARTFATSGLEETKSVALAVDLQVNRVPISNWGCGSVETDYIKVHKVGQGSYGFELLI